MAKCYFVTENNILPLAVLISLPPQVAFRPLQPFILSSLLPFYVNAYHLFCFLFHYSSDRTGSAKTHQSQDMARL